MKDQYVIGLPKSEFIRVMGYDMYSVLCTMDKESVEGKKLLIDKNRLKVYKLVEVEI